MSEEEGVLRGIDYRDPLVKYRGERISYTLKKLLGKDVQVNESFLVDTYYVHYLPLPVTKGKSEIKQNQNIMYSLVDSILSSDIVLKNREYSIVNSAVSLALTVSYVQNLIEELERI
ncbi:MAG: hypothetical protein QXE55_06485, partial [Saccharolobus sp.]